jgi:hypothetical protein
MQYLIFLRYFIPEQRKQLSLTPGTFRLLFDGARVANRPVSQESISKVDAGTK